MRTQLVVGCVLLLGACTSKTRDQAPPAGSASAVTASDGSAAGAGSAVGSGSGPAAPAVPVTWERQDLSKLEGPLPVTVEVPTGFTVELHKVAFGNKDTPRNEVTLVGPDWRVNIVALGDKVQPSVAVAIRARSLTPEMVVTSKDLDDGGWILVWKQPTNEHFVASVRKAVKVACNSDGPIKAEHVETIVKLCDSLRPAP